jgi:tetratricopeptide (TPR) repeat protein
MFTFVAQNLTDPMKIIYTTLLLGLLLASCKKVSPEEKAVNDACKIVQSSGNDSSYVALSNAINTLVETKGYADSTSAKQILKAAHLCESKNRYSEAVDYYEMYLAHYADRPDQADKLMALIGLTEKETESQLSQILYKSFVNRFPDDPRAKDLAAKIELKEITVDSTLRHIGMNMFNDSTFRLNEPMANMYIQGSELAAAADPKLVSAPEHLHRAAETARTLRDLPRAIKIYDWIITVYPESPRGATSLFLKAFTYDNDLKDYTKAAKYYNEFLTKYPNNDFTESAKFLLQNLGKSEEELKKILDEKSKENISNKQNVK